MPAHYPSVAVKRKRNRLESGGTAKIRKMKEYLKGKDLWWGVITLTLLLFLMALITYCVITGKSVKEVSDIKDLLKDVVLLLIGYRYGSSKGSKDKGEQLKRTDVAAAIVFLLVFCAGCKTLKTNTSHTAIRIEKKDSVSQVKRSDSFSHVRIVKDTVVTQPKKEVEFNILPADAAPAYTGINTASPIQVPRTFVKDTNGIRVQVTLLPTGGMNIKVNAEAVWFRLENLTTDSLRVINIYDSLYMAGQEATSTTVDNTDKVTEKGLWGWKLINYLIAAVLGALVGYIICLLRKIGNHGSV